MVLRNQVSVCRNLSGKGHVAQLAATIVETCPREELLVAIRHLSPIAARMGEAPLKNPSEYPTWNDIYTQRHQQQNLRDLLSSIADPDS